MHLYTKYKYFIWFLGASVCSAQFIPVSFPFKLQYGVCFYRPILTEQLDLGIREAFLDTQTQRTGWFLWILLLYNVQIVHVLCMIILWGVYDNIAR